MVRWWLVIAVAPTCTTCHGFQMDIATVAPVRTAERCGICHNAQQGVKAAVARRAKELLTSLNDLRERIKRAQVALDLAEQDSVAPADAAQTLRRTSERLGATGALWHRFELESFERELADIGGAANEAYAAARRALIGKK